MDAHKDRTAPPRMINSPSRYPTGRATNTPGLFSERARGKHLPDAAWNVPRRSDYRLARRQERCPTDHAAIFSPCRTSPSRLERPVADHEAFNRKPGQNKPQVLERVGHQRTIHANQMDSPRATATSSLPPVGCAFPTPAEHRKPTVLGSQTAVVTGPQGGRKSTANPYGRIKRCSFSWNRRRLGQ